jgi:transposase-like protein
MARGRTFSREFKLAAVQDVVSGAKRPAQVCREHGLSEGLLLRWRREVAERGEAAFGPPDGTSAVALERQIAELERFCGQLALENAALKKGLNTPLSRSGTR